jgi:hypothetical protein
MLSQSCRVTGNLSLTMTQRYVRRTSKTGKRRPQCRIQQLLARTTPPFCTTFTDPCNSLYGKDFLSLAPDETQALTLRLAIALGHSRMNGRTSSVRSFFSKNVSPLDVLPCSSLWCHLLRLRVHSGWLANLFSGTGKGRNHDPRR